MRCKYSYTSELMHSRNVCVVLWRAPLSTATASGMKAIAALKFTFAIRIRRAQR
jgi:hypothetical protein